MLGEIHIVVRRDQRDGRPLALRRPVDALARMPADLAAWCGRRRDADELRIALRGELCVLGARGGYSLSRRLGDALLGKCLIAEPEGDAGAANERRTPVHPAHEFLREIFLSRLSAARPRAARCFRAEARPPCAR